MRKMFCRMHLRKHRQKIPVQRRRIRHARISQQHGKHARQRNPQHHARHHLRRTMPVQPLHEQTRQKFRILRLAPRHHAQNARLHQQIQRRNSQHRQKNPARNVFLRLLDLSTQMANVVVAPVAVHRAHHRRSQPRKPQRRKRKCSRRKIKRDFAIEMRHSSPDQPQHRSNHARPQQHGNLPNRRNSPVQKHNQHQHQPAGNRFRFPFVQWMQIARVARKSNRSRRHRKWRLYKRLPHEQERHQPPPLVRSVRFAQKYVRPARLRHRRAQFAPDERVQRRNHRARQPRDHRLRPAHRLDHQRAHHERANPHYLNHVQRDGLFQPQPALQLPILRCSCRGRLLSRPFRPFVGDVVPLPVPALIHRPARIANPPPFVFSPPPMPRCLRAHNRKVV